MPLPATYGYDDPIDTLSSSFNVIEGGPRCDGSSRGRGGLGYNVAVWNADTPNADHYVKLTDVIGANYGGPVCRFSLTVMQGYAVVWDFSGNSILRRFDGSSASFVDIATGMGASGAGVEWEFRPEGTTINVYRNGVLVASPTDSNYASGTGGFLLYDGTARCDAFELGNLTPAVPPPAVSQYFNQRNRLRPRLFAPGRPR